MKTAPSLCALAMAALLSSPANAFYKCVAKGEVMYQDRPCLVGTETVVKIVVPAFGESPRKLFQYSRPNVEAAAKDDSFAVIRVPVVVTPPPQD